MKRSKAIKSLAEFYEIFSKDSQEYFIVFIDLCNSTNYKQAIIDAKLPASIWLHRQLIFLQGVSRFITSCGGKVIKTLGDGVLAVFDYTEQGEEILYNCITLSRIFENLSSFADENKIQMKISIDYGETINGSVEDGVYDPIGLCVDRCSRLNSKAGPNKITISAELRNKILSNNLVDLHKNIRTIKTYSKSIKGLGKIKYYIVEIS